jgi:hypothetical protein
MRSGIFSRNIRKLLRKHPSDIRDSGLEYISGPVPDPGQEGWYVFSTVRNERLRLPYFLHFYREMGTKLFVIADNQSQDGTTAYLQGQPDVLLFRACGSFSESMFGISWLNALLHQFGQNRWCLTVDADELLVFPHCEQLKLRGLVRYLEARGANALPTFLLDMYSREPIGEAICQVGTPFLSVCPFFDSTGYLKQERRGPTHNVPTRGGPRYRLFWERYIREKPSPYLPKVPLVRWSKSLYYTSNHHISNARVSDVTGVLLHFKFFADFPSRVEEEVGRREHFSHASQYAAYWEVISQQPDVRAFYEGSVRYECSLQLMEMGLLHSSKAFDLLSSPARKPRGSCSDM